MRDKLFSYLFTVLVCVYPVLIIYGIRFPFVLVIMLILDLGMLVQKKCRIGKEDVLLIVFAVFVFLQLFFTDNGFQNWTSVIHYLSYIGTCVLFVTDNFDYGLAKKCLLTVTLFATGYLILQYVVLMIAGIYVPGTFGFLPNLREELTEFNNSGNMLYTIEGLLMRPRSIFPEPGAFGSYAVLTLAVLLFDQDSYVEWRELIPALAVSAGMILSLASTSILLCAFVWGLYFLRMIFTRLRDKRIWWMIAVVSILFGGFMISPFGRFFLRRISFQSNSVLARFENIHLLFESDLMEILLGHGMVNETQIGYMPDIFRSIYFYGIIGTGVFIAYLVGKFIKGDVFMRILIAVILFSAIGGSGFIGVIFFYYFPFLMVADKHQEVS